MNEAKQPIPSIPHRFFKWYCQPSRYEEMHGDLEEIFQERFLHEGKFKAQLGYWVDIMRCCQPYAWKKMPALNLHHYMISNYSKTTLRSLFKNPLSSVINVLGLAVAIGICLVVYAFLSWDNSRDQFHQNKNEVYLATIELNMDGKLQRYGTSPLPLGTALLEDFPQVKKICRIDDMAAIVKNDDLVFHEEIRFTDPTFLEMFTFPLKWGQASTLSDLNSIVISEKMSQKYFGEENPIGKNIQVIIGEGRSKVFAVGGVAAEFPEEHVITFDFLVGIR